jgi:hypothetical protein
MLKEEKGVCASRLVNRLGDDSVLRVVCESVFLPEVPLEDKEQMMQDCIRRLKDERLKLERQRLQEEIRLAQDSGDEKRLRVLMQDFHNLVKVR